MNCWQKLDINCYLALLASLGTTPFVVTSTSQNAHWSPKRLKRAYKERILAITMPPRPQHILRGHLVQPGYANAALPFPSSTSMKHALTPIPLSRLQMNSGRGRKSLISLCLAMVISRGNGDQLDYVLFSILYFTCYRSKVSSYLVSTRRTQSAGQ